MLDAAEVPGPADPAKGQVEVLGEDGQVAYVAVLNIHVDSTLHVHVEAPRPERIDLGGPAKSAEPPCCAQRGLLCGHWCGPKPANV